MKAFFKFITQPWLVSLLGLLALSLVVWIVGPLIAVAGYEPLIGEIPRFIVIFVLTVIWGLGNLRKQHEANKANEEIAEGLVAAAPSDEEPDASGEEVAALRERFEQALELLRKSRGDKGKLNLYELPWYMIIGPPGSGKSTALLNSGLNFPLAERYGQEAVKGIGGTRTCDWWFTDEAVLLDTAGRYTTQDSDQEVDRGAWEGFLALLKKYRKRRPLNGVLVAISAQDLLQQTPGERAAHAQAIRRRVQELYEFFGMRFPIYVLLTKIDLVAGFNQYFEDFSQENREQVWGMTFPLPED
ncbi:MAG: type VI secretion system membrane subunit TssM, partial [Pseudomonadota bacterium]